MEPTAAAASSPAWVPVALGIIAMLAPLVYAVAQWIKVQAQRDALILGLEESGSKVAKESVARVSKERGVELDTPITHVTGRPTGRLKNGGSP